MAECWMLNASPLTLAEQVVVPRPVAEEIQAGPPPDPAQQALASGRFTMVDTPPPLCELLAWDLGYGETAVLSWAIAQSGWTAILHDAGARKCAQAFSVADWL